MSPTVGSTAPEISPKGGIAPRSDSPSGGVSPSAGNVPSQRDVTSIESGIPSVMGKRVFLILAAISTALVTLSGLLYVAVVLTQSQGQPGWDSWKVVFDVATEYNVSTWYNSMLWVLLAVAVLMVAAQTSRRRLSWIIFALIAIYASIDEFAMLHEQLSGFGARLGEFLPVNFFSYSWVIAGILIAVVVVVLLAPLVLSLPRRVMYGIFLGGAIFLFGAVVLETVGGFIEAHFGMVTWHLMLAIHIEEWFEMLGICVAIAAVLEMLRWSRYEDGTVTMTFRGYRR